MLCLMLSLFAVQDDARENLIISEKKVRQLESQVQDGQLACANNKKVCIDFHYCMLFAENLDDSCPT
jgi:hypothetical protein